MFWHEILYDILTVINNVILVIIGIPFFIQLLYMIFGWVKKTTFKKSEHKNRVCILIPARNEEDVIYDTVRRIYEKQNYPKELLDVFVVAHNCTDRTAELAKKAGATVFVLNDPNPAHHKLVYANKFGYEEIKKLDKKYDFTIRMDADNHLNDDFVSLMNDCFNSGVEMARPYESALNMSQNRFTKACGLYYTFDSRFASRVRERIGIDAHVNGPGMMISMDIINKHGYDGFSMSEDTEFTFSRMIEGYRLHFVEDAVVYEDLPSTFKDTLARNKRIGAGNIRLLFTKGLEVLFSFFKNFRFSCFEIFVTQFFIVICVILCTWIPLYYIYSVTYLALAGNNIFATSMGAEYYMSILTTTLIVIAVALGFLFIFAGILQGLLLVFLDYKKLGAKSPKELISGAFLFPAFTVVYCLTICIGVLSKPKWTKVNRNKNYINNNDK